MGDGIGHLIESGHVQIVRILIAELVVAGIVRLACSATVDRGLLGGLRSLGAGEEAAGRDPHDR